LLYRNIS